MSILDTFKRVFNESQIYPVNFEAVNCRYTSLHASESRTPNYLQFPGIVFWVFWHFETRTLDTFKHDKKNKYQIFADFRCGLGSTSVATETRAGRRAGRAGSKRRENRDFCARDRLISRSRKISFPGSILENSSLEALGPAGPPAGLKARRPD